MEDIFSLLNELSYFCREKHISDRGCREGFRLQKEVIPLEKESKKPEFSMFLLLDSKIGYQETSKWLTALIDDHINNLEKKNGKLLSNI